MRALQETLEKNFNKYLESNPEGSFKEINDIFFENMRLGVPISRFKIYISSLLSDLTYRDSIEEELAELKKARKNIGSIITTNYDNLAQDIFEFNPLVGNDILLSNPYGSVYKIHGSISDPNKIIITKPDYENFKVKYELIRSQLLSLFIHNPIIFLGYNVGDDNIKELLKTIFSYVESNTDVAKKIRENFLLVEYEEGSENLNIVEHDIDVEGFSTIRINKIRTNNFSEIYRVLAELSLPISAMDVRKFQSIAKEIYEGGNIQVSFTEDMDEVNNGDKIIAIGSRRTIQYNFHTISEMISDYFKIIEDSNDQLLLLVNKQRIADNQYFPIYGFSKVCEGIEEESRLKKQQTKLMNDLIKGINRYCINNHQTIQDIILDENISLTNKSNAISWGVWHENLKLDEVADYLKIYEDKKETGYRKFLCMFDYKKHANL